MARTERKRNVRLLPFYRVPIFLVLKIEGQQLTIVSRLSTVKYGEPCLLWFQSFRHLASRPSLLDNAKRWFQSGTPARNLVLYSYEKFLSELGAKVRSMRKERGWTFRHMIVAHGYHLAHWQGLEKGRGISVPCQRYLKIPRIGRLKNPQLRPSPIILTHGGLGWCDWRVSWRYRSYISTE